MLRTPGRTLGEGSLCYRAPAQPPVSEPQGHVSARESLSSAPHGLCSHLWPDRQWPENLPLRLGDLTGQFLGHTVLRRRWRDRPKVPLLFPTAYIPQKQYGDENTLLSGLLRSLNKITGERGIPRYCVLSKCYFHPLPEKQTNRQTSRNPLP